MQYSVRISLYPLPPPPSPLPSPLFPLRYVSSLFTTTARCCSILDAIIRGNYSQPKGSAYLPISPELRSKGWLSTPSPVFSPPFRSHDQPTAPAMTIATNCYAPRLRCECVPESLCERLRDVFACTCMLCARVCTRMRIHVCISVRGESRRALQQLRQTSN